MSYQPKIRPVVNLANGFLFVLSLATPVMAHPGGITPPVHPPVHPGIPVHPTGGANMGMAHMSPTPANFGQTVSGVASSQGQTISQDAKSGMTGQALSAVANQHGQVVSGVATGSTPLPPPPGGAPAPPPAGGAPAPLPAP